MPASRDINHYAGKWMNLFNLMQDDPLKDIVIPCDTVKEAKRMRLEFYKARAALMAKEEPDRLSAESGDLAAVEAYKEYCHPNLNKKEVLIDGTNVVFGYRDKSRIADLLTNALKEYGGDLNEI